MSYVMEHPRVIQASQSERAAFIRRTYGHLAGAILAFVGLELLIFKTLDVNRIVGAMLGNQITWLLVMVAFIGVAWLADSWARSDVSQGLQYLGLGLYIVAEAVIFIPILWIASQLGDPNIIPTAGIMTLGLFGGLTVAVLTTRKDFSFLRPIVGVASFLLLGLIIAFMFVGGPAFGLIIAFVGVALASAAILYQTSGIMLHYRTDQYVAASLGLFASVATMFYYILYILMASRE